jgi:hypothetical protein
MLVCYAKSSFQWKDAHDPRFDPGRNGHGVPLTSLVGGQLSFWWGQVQRRRGLDRLRILIFSPSFGSLLYLRHKLRLTNIPNEL